MTAIDDLRCGRLGPGSRWPWTSGAVRATMGRGVRHGPAPEAGGPTMPGRSHTTAVLGRDTALDEVAHFVEAVGTAPAALLLEGEPGIGKTTVWRSARAAAADRGHRVL